MQRELISFRGHNRDVTYAAWHTVHEELFVSGGHDGSMIFWLASRQAPQASTLASAHLCAVGPGSVVCCRCGACVGGAGCAWGG